MTAGLCLWSFLWISVDGATVGGSPAEETHRPLDQPGAGRPLERSE